MMTHFSKTYQTNCRILEEISLWDHAYFRVWLQEKNEIVQVPASDLIDLSETQNPQQEAYRIQYAAAAAKITQTLSYSDLKGMEPILLSPMDANIIPLPHQLNALSRAMSKEQIRYLLADEVGLGKTIEAGLILRELKLRGLVRRILIVAPKSLATQWISEMETHFREKFQLILPGEIQTLQRFQNTILGLQEREVFPNSWAFFDQVVVSMDSVKPMDGRKGWSAEQVAEYNKDRFEDLISAGWDLIIVDEAHRLGGSADTVARYKLGQGLAQAAPYFLLLTATPHQGKTDSFFRIISLLDEKTFPDPSTVRKETVRPFLIRTEKRKAVDENNQPIFQPRHTRVLRVKWGAVHQQQALLYKLVTEYVRYGYNQAMREKKYHIGFLMVLMQRLVVSSTQAIRVSLEHRLKVLKNDSFLQKNNVDRTEDELDNLYDLDGQELLELLLTSRDEVDMNEVGEVKLLLEQAQRCEQNHPDAKAEALLETIYTIQAEENDPDLKILIFTEFIPTQFMLQEFLEKRGFKVALLNGSLSMQEREQVQEAFRRDARILISTDAGGEGLNLQFCHIVFNYDVPWNPMRLEQRIGRVDRIGQAKPVKAINLIFEESVEFRVREVLEEKLQVIYKEFGIDKTGDVLDSGQAGKFFENAFIKTVSDPDKLETNVEESIADFREEVVNMREQDIITTISDEPPTDLARNIKYHPLNHWIETMVIAYHCSKGASAMNFGEYWQLLDPVTKKRQKLAFLKTNYLYDDLPDVEKINMQSEQVKQLLQYLPQQSVEQLVPKISMINFPGQIKGIWALYQVSVKVNDKAKFKNLKLPSTRTSTLPVFFSEDERTFIPTARKIWDMLITEPIHVNGFLDQESSREKFEVIREIIQAQGKDSYLNLMSEHEAWLEKETQRGEIYYQSKENAIGRIGLPEVKQFRLNKLENEKNAWKQELIEAKSVLPELKIVLVVSLGDQ